MASSIETRHPGVQSLYRWLTPNPKLPGLASEIAHQHHIVASTMIAHLPDGPELTAGLRKLLEAKDCFVRAALETGSDD